MRCRIFMVILLLLPVRFVSAAATMTELEQQVMDLTQQVQQLQEETQRQHSEQNLPVGARPDVGQSERNEEAAPVDLSLQENFAITDDAQSKQDQGNHVLENPWWQNFEIYGFAAAGLYGTGSARPKDETGFEIKEATLFIEATVWEDIGVFVEFQTNRLGNDASRFTRTGEVYIHYRDIALGDSTSIGMKLGRIDLPFGEEYLWQDAIDNPLIQNSAAWPYGTDEGIEFYGRWRGVNWIVAATDGQLTRSTEDDSAKALNVKISGDPTDSLYLSFSAMHNGETSTSAMQFAGSFLQPIGGFGHASSLGNSPSKKIDATYAEIDAIYTFSAFSNRDGHLWLSLGAVEIDDSDPAFERSFQWFSIEPMVQFHQHWYAIVRYSEVGTHDANAGYHFDGKTFGGGNASFGYDTKRLRRLSIGLGWTPNPRVRGKIEIGNDWFDLIDASAFETKNSDRNFVGLELAVGF